MKVVLKSIWTYLVIRSLLDLLDITKIKWLEETRVKLDFLGNRGGFLVSRNRLVLTLGISGLTTDLLA